MMQQFYWLRKNKLVENRKLLMSNSGAIKISELDAQDTDNITDWRLAELKFKLVEMFPNKYACLKK